jgi:hypothetical protein
VWGVVEKDCGCGVGIVVGLGEGVVVVVIYGGVIGVLFMIN